MLLLSRVLIPHSFLPFPSFSLFSSRKPIPQLLESITHSNQPISKCAQYTQSQDKVSISLKVTKDFRRLSAQIKEHLIKHGYKDVEVRLERENKVTHFESNLRNVGKVVAVTGGLGKTTATVGLARALREKGKRVGVLEADVYSSTLPAILKAERLYAQPYIDNGISYMSYNFLEESKGQSFIRGTAASSAVSKMISKTPWGNLDILLVDVPKQHGDIAFAVYHQLKFAGAVGVLSPLEKFQEFLKSLRFFNQHRIRLLGVVENLGKGIYSQSEGNQPKPIKTYTNILKKNFGLQNIVQLPVMRDPHAISSSHLLTFADNIISSLSSDLKQRKIVHYNTGSQKIEVIKQGKPLKRLDSYPLRLKCQCPECVDENTGRSLINEQKLDKQVFPNKIQQLGNAAVLIQWSDGHLTSIYSIQSLVSM